MRIATCNVNGLRAAVKKGAPAWFEEHTPDILLLQEVRAPEELVFDLLGGKYQVFQQACQIKGRAGVVVAVRDGIEVSRVSIGLGAGLAEEDGGYADGSAKTVVVSPNEPAADTGRWVEVDVPSLKTTFVSTYLFSGNATDQVKMDQKYAHLDRVTQRLGELRHDRPADLPHVLVAGDFNIVHTARDITNWKSNHNKTAGVLDREIAYLDNWLTDLNYVDVHRSLMGEEQADYTWWSQRGQAFDKNVGWRIDYQMTTPELAVLAQSARVDRAASYDTRWSDHAPLVIDYEMD